ncbi:Casein kinase II subunit beta-1 [Pseudocercospora fuligena]|uniref:Casein kinase II subunit beta n=1 Tax=Pseudocercospora fuligena TaxID=685502 RepID=A0A8H6RB71_9PEZI|nr:Casein kinase II subunit beta-1 [Pseudocercospora fuligena]
MLYGLIHQRFITSRQGIQQMAEKYELGHFGHCPRVFCHGAKVLPVGCSDIPGQETVKLFCPSCLDVYTPPNSRFQTVDGAFFGTTFGCLFFMTFPELDVGGIRPPPIDPSSPVSETTREKGRNSLSSSLGNATQQIPAPPVETALPKQPDTINGIAPKNLAPGLGPGSIYEPRIYGFRVSEIAKTGPRMKWLRSRPQDVNELDECRIWAENQEAMMSTTGGDAAGDEDAMPAFADSEMADDNEEIDEGEQEDQDMDGRNGDEQGLESRDVAAQRRKAVNRRKAKHEDSGAGLVNGESSRSAVRVGDGG